jgi:ferredoxin
MPDLTDRKPENILGRFYVDTTCIDCDICRDSAPDFFRRDDDTGQSYVYRQPVTAEEVALAQEALEGCPTSSIGDDEAAA